MPKKAPVKAAKKAAPKPKSAPETESKPKAAPKPKALSILESDPTLKNLSTRYARPIDELSIPAQQIVIGLKTIELLDQLTRKK